MVRKIKEALLNTKISTQLIDKYLAKQSIIDIAIRLNLERIFDINNYICYIKKNQGEIFVK